MPKLPVRRTGACAGRRPASSAGSSARRGPRSVATLWRAAIRRAAARTELLGHSAARAVVGHRRAPRSAAAPPRARRRARASQSRAIRSSCTSTPISAASSQASVPGFTWRWMSAISAVSVRRGSTTIRAALGILRDLAQRHARARDAVREPRVLAEEERRPRSARSRRASSRRSSCSATQNSPVFSCASALELMHRAEHRGASRARTRRAGGCPARRRRSRRSTRRRSVSRTAAKRAATSRIAVSQSISSNVPSARRRSGFVSRCGPFW